MQDLLFTNEPWTALDCLVERIGPSGVFVVVDDNTRRCVLPLMQQRSRCVADATVISIPPGEEHKTVSTVEEVWAELQSGGATRHSLIVNLGGGLVTDLGGFAAACFKRGMRFVNIPTSLLGAVDAAVGGKTGVNFGGLKNEIGVFREADAVVISTCFFSTLPTGELQSGYAEMLKHGLLKSREATARLLDLQLDASVDPEALLALLRESVEVKRDIVAQDPTEKGIRKALNLGHTAGHAFEALAMKRAEHLPHGHAVASGLIVALVLSHMKEGMDSSLIHSLAAFVDRHYIKPRITCDDYPALIDMMKHDKKNRHAGDLCFTLLRGPGEPLIDRFVSEEDIRAVIDIMRDLLHI